MQLRAPTGVEHILDAGGEKVRPNFLVVIVDRGRLRCAVPVAELVLVGVTEISHPAFTLREHRARAHVKNSTAARAGVNDARCKHSGQQTTTCLYRYC